MQDAASLEDIKREIADLHARKAVATRAHREAMHDCVKKDGSPDTAILVQRRADINSMEARLRELEDQYYLISLRGSQKRDSAEKTVAKGDST